MRNSLIVAVSLLGLMSGGCTEEEAERAAPATPAIAAEPAQAPPAVVEAAAQVAPAVPAAPGQPAAPTATGSVTNTRQMQQVGVVIEAALAAAAAIPTEGNDRCGIAYAGLEVMSAHVRQAMPEQPTNPIPPRDAFLEACRSLPQEVQQCLVVSHALSHQAECQRSLDGLDPAALARMEALMGGR